MNLLLKNKLDLLKEILISYQKLLIAYSGGIDSTLLVAAAKHFLPDNYLAVTFITPLQTKKEIDDARYIAKKLNMNYLEILENILLCPEIKNNQQLRCYHCKKILFKKLIAMAKVKGYPYIADGSNKDDENSCRPGILALQELNIKSPLKEAGFTKDDVRQLAKDWGLENYLKPASPCLATRFPYNTELNTEKLFQVEKGENIISSYGFDNFRLRHHDNVCRIELSKEDWPKIFSISDKIINELKDLGFSYITIDLEGFRSGVFDKK